LLGGSGRPRWYDLLVSFEQIDRLPFNRNPHGLVPERTLDRNRPVSDQVTVVLLTFNCGHRLVPILDHLRDLGLPTIAVDNASVDHTADVLRERGDLEVIALPVNIGAAGRNHGVQRAETPYVLFCDDDGWWQPGGSARRGCAARRPSAVGGGEREDPGRRTGPP